MSHTDWRTRLGLFQATVFAAAALLLSTGCGQPAGATPKTADTKAAERDGSATPSLTLRRPGSEAKETEVAMADITDAGPAEITVPNGTPDELLKFIDDLQTREPQVNSREAFRAEMAVRAKAINKAADKILATPNLDEPTRVTAVQAKIGALVQNLQDPEGIAALRKFITSVAKDKDPQLAASAQKLLVDLRRVSIQMGDDSDAPAVLADIKSRISGDTVELRDLAQAAQSAEALEMADPPSLAIQAYAAIVKALDKIDPALLTRPEAKGLVDQVREMAESSTRRLDRIGKPLDIEGTLLDGKPLDWSKYRGKIVLVDFWATWCGPCIQELPNVKENYTRFHDKGFDVVGVSLDENREAVTKFLAQEGILWPTLFSDDPKDQGWSNPLVRKFDINGIPATFLVDREGKLISMAARGPRLTAQLQKLLGNPK